MVRIHLPPAVSHQRTVPGVGFNGVGRPRGFLQRRVRNKPFQRWASMEPRTACDGWACWACSRACPLFGCASSVALGLALARPDLPFWARLQLLARLTLNPGKHAGNEPARLAHLDNGYDRAILVQGDEGPAQVVRLGHRWHSIEAISSPLVEPIGDFRVKRRPSARAGLA